MFSSDPCQAMRPFLQIVTKPPPAERTGSGFASKLRHPNSAEVAENTVLLRPGRNAVTGAGWALHAPARKAEAEPFIGALFVFRRRVPMDAVLALAGAPVAGLVERRPAVVAGFRWPGHGWPAVTTRWTTTGRVWVACAKRSISASSASEQAPRTSISSRRPASA